MRLKKLTMAEIEMKWKRQSIDFSRASICLLLNQTTKSRIWF